jgi:hypothetical protein
MTYPTHLIGVSSLTEMIKGNKIVYIFGEEHTHKYLCDDKKIGSKEDNQNKMKIDSFIKLILESHPDKDFDIYTEEEYISKDKDKRYRFSFDKEFKNSGLDNILRTFKDCLYIVKKCPYKNVRFHYTDIRFVYPDIINILNIVSDIENIMRNELTMDLIDSLHRMFSALIYFIGIYNFSYNENLLKKQLTKIDNKLLDKIIKDRMQHYIPFFENLPIIIKDIESYYRKDNRKFRNYITDFTFTIMAYFANYMDFYLVARMLKDYAKNIMIFTGNSHSENIIFILEQLGFEKINEYRIKKDGKTILNNCVNLKGFSEFFER